jgi:hypothetical protein
MAAFIDDNAIQVIFGQPLPDGSFEKPARDYLQAAGARHPLLLLAFAPKCAGTFLRQAAVHALDGQLVRMCHAQAGRDGTLYLPNILAWSLDDDARATVTHIHMQALDGNRHFIQAVGLKPVIMIRNIADALASFLDMLEVDPVARAEGLNCQVPGNFCDLDRGDKLDFMIDVIAPWYASYYATWRSFTGAAGDTVCVLRYREFRENPAETLYRAIVHAGFATTRYQCGKSVEHAWSGKENFRFNRGISGRGKSYFTPSHFARLQKLLSYYPHLSGWKSDLLD